MCLFNSGKHKCSKFMETLLICLWMSAEEEQQSDTGDASLNESSLLETCTSEEVQPTPEAKSPIVESTEPPAPKIASPVQQVISNKKILDHRYITDLMC